MASQSPSRLFGFDVARTFLMLTVVPYHAARLFGSGRANPVLVEHRADWPHYFAEFLNSFHMAGFFAIAGLFSFMSLQRREPGAWAKTRLERIGIPLLCATLLFAPLNAALVAINSIQEGQTPGPFSTEVWLDLLFSRHNIWALHLWFLGVLLLLSLAAAALVKLGRAVPALQKPVSRFADLSLLLTKLPPLLGAIPIAFACVLFWVLPAVLRGGLGLNTDPFFPFFDVERALQFAPFFALGGLFHARPALLAWFLQKDRIVPLLAISASVLFVVASDMGGRQLALRSVSACFAAVYWLQWVLSVANRHFNKPNSRLIYLNDAALSIYLFHMPIVLAMGVLLFNSTLPMPLAFLLVLTVAFTGAILIHEVVRRSAWLSFLFNGIPLPGKPKP